MADEIVSAVDGDGYVNALLNEATTVYGDGLGLQMMIYGDSGVGKTVFASTVLDVESLKPVLMVDTDFGTRSIASKVRHIKFNELDSPDPDKINCLHISSYEELERIFGYIKNPKIKDKYKTIIIDTLTEINEMCLVEVSMVDRAQILKGSVQIQHYGAINMGVRRCIKMIKSSGLNAIFLCQVNVKEDQVTQVSKVVPALTGKLTYESRKMMDIVGYYQINSGNQREMVFQPTNKINAKDRIEGSQLGNKLINPTMKEILEKIQA